MNAFYAIRPRNGLGLLYNNSAQDRHGPLHYMGSKLRVSNKLQSHLCYQYLCHSVIYTIHI